MCKATFFVELDEPTVTAIRNEVKSLFHEFEFLVVLGACLAVTLTAALSSISYYLSGNYQMSQSLGLPVIAGMCGMMILTYVAVSSPPPHRRHLKRELPVAK